MHGTLTRHESFMSAFVSQHSHFNQWSISFQFIKWLLQPGKLRYLAVGREVVGISGLLSPRALDGVAVDVGVVHRHDGVRGRLLRRKSEKSRHQFIKGFNTSSKTTYHIFGP